LIKRMGPAFFSWRTAAEFIRRSPGNAVTSPSSGNSGISKGSVAGQNSRINVSQRIWQKTRILMSIEVWIAYVSIVTLILIIPGPTIILVVSQAVTHGPKSVIPLVAGGLHWSGQECLPQECSVQYFSRLQRSNQGLALKMLYRGELQSVL
jgi:hypothetical protein